MFYISVWVIVGLLGYYHGPFLNAEKDTDTREMVWLAIGYMMFGPFAWIGNMIVNSVDSANRASLDKPNELKDYKSKSEKSTLPNDSSGDSSTGR